MGAVCVLLAILLVVLPPIEISGVSVWLYLTPAVIAVYALPLRFTAPFVILASLFSVFFIGQGSPSFVAEAVASSVFLISLGAWRSVTGSSDSLLIATNLLLFAALPTDALLNYYWADAMLQNALLAAAGYALSSLIALLLAEMFVVVVVLGRIAWLDSIRDMLAFRPSLVQVVELIIGTAVTLSFFMILSLFWQTWQSSLDESTRDGGDARFNTLFLNAEATTAARLDAAARVASGLLSGDLLKGSEVANRVREILVDDHGASDTKLPPEIAFAHETRGIYTTSGLEQVAAERAFALARAQVTSGLVSIELRMPDASLRNAMVMVSRMAESPDILVMHEDVRDTVSFVYGDAKEKFAKAYALPIGLVGDYGPDSLVDNELPEGAKVLESNSAGWVVWQLDPTPRKEDGRSLRSRLQALADGAFITLSPGEAVISRFGAVLPVVQDFRVTMDYWELYASFARAITSSTALGLILLAGLLWLSRFLIGGLVRPLAELTTVFESWRQFRGGELGSGAALQAMDARGFSRLDDIHGLQVGFRSLAQDVMYGERRLSTIAANYDELLRSLPLGVLAVDGASRVQFLNDALGEITEQRQDAISRLKSQAAQMLATNTTVDEWQLTLEDRPPKSLLLVVNHRLDDRGQESGLWVIATDLTEQKQTNAQLIQASKLATLGEMSTGMAHELNQPLNVISLATSNLRFSIKKGKANPENTMSKLDRIDGAVHRAASIIDHMRAYGRLAGEGLSEINIGEVIQGACNLLSEQLKLANISLVNEVPGGGLLVQGNAIQLEQVLINLINNAKDAIRDKGQAGQITVDSELAGGRVLIRVTDTGGGIPEHALPHIFEPFFTTKPVGKGTGLGGSISYGIVREMQGDIWAENVPGGAQITISLPLLRSGLKS